jgi:hypothetical protein
MVPHRDVRLSLRKWSGDLFAAGFDGAWSFPWLTPLALLSLPFSAAELKALALALRGQTLAGNGEGKFKTGAAAEADFPKTGAGDAGGGFVFGPLLYPELPDLVFPKSALDKILYRFSPAVLGSALIGGEDKARRGGVPPARYPPPPELSFRAAALANMNFRSLPCGDGNYSCEWETGKLCWLPAVRGQKNFSGGRDFAACPEGRSGHGEAL